MKGCRCYRVLGSMTPEEKQQAYDDHVAAGLHSMGCPMWVDRTPMYSRAGDSLPSYTAQQQRRDAETEAGLTR